jgi:flagellar assembly protein FliH
MGLIKSREAPPTTSAFSMRDVGAQAVQILERARSQAESLVRDAELEGQRIRAQQFETGFREGKAAGMAEGLAEGRKQGYEAALAAQSARIEELMTALAGSAAKLEASRRQLESETVYDVVRLAIAIGRRVTKKLGDVEPEVVRANVHEALRMVINASAVKVALNPGQLAMLERDLPAIRAMFPKIEQVELVGDESLSPGGCRLIAGSGMVDADLDTQLDRVVADLLPPDTGAPV